MSEADDASIPPCSFRSHAAEIMVARLHDNFHLVAKFELSKNLS